MDLKSSLIIAIKQLHAVGIPKCTEAAECLSRIKEWCYPELSTETVALITRCKHCKNYKRYKKKNSLKPVYTYRCKLDGSKREPSFFCGDAVDRRKTNEQ